MRERSAGGGRAEDFTIAASETLDALCVQQGFGCRQQGEAVDSARCPLVCRIEAADTLDFVAEEIELQRLFLARREKVYDPAAHSALARVGRCFHPHIAVRSEEHTSELQSLMRISYAVFCLKKKTQIYTLYLL